MAVEITTRGLDDLNRRLTQLLPRAVRRALNAALMAGSRIGVKEIKADAPVDTGKLKKVVTSRLARPSQTQATAAVHIGVKRDAFYWMFIEFGTSRHPARPFLRPAFERSKEAMVAKVAERLRQRIAIEAAKS